MPVMTMRKVVCLSALSRMLTVIFFKRHFSVEEIPSIPDLFKFFSIMKIVGFFKLV